MMNVLSEINKKGCTIIVITHDMRLAAKYAQHVVVLTRGKILADGPTRDILSKPDLLRKASLLPPQITRLGQALEGFGMPRDVLTVDEMYKILEAMM
jgi:energy-coupling factor transport system ATP-binding protein